MKTITICNGYNYIWNMHQLRLFLLPISWIYGLITFIRNKLFDVGFFKQYSIPKKSICVGNLAIGGTGKSPHVNYLVNLLKESTKITILSRGYGRKTRGFILADNLSTGSSIGDEPKMYFNRFNPSVQVVVCEKRAEGVKKINKILPDNELIILDDAFQHRAVKAEVNLLITDFASLFSSDYVLPAGNLREWKIGKNRADYIIVSKCPSKITEEAKEIISKQLKFNSAKIFFSTIKYGALIPFTSTLETNIEAILLVTGIANPKPLIQELEKKHTLKTVEFPDHHNYTISDIERIHQIFDTFAVKNKAIVTTEKDFMRFSEMIETTKMNKYPWIYQSIEIEIDRKDIFNKEIKEYVNTI